ncbi:hypothetical protein FQN55_007377 [Onygenales sp. PD_40]|nr:hypothetical protein FQN55_007377 [Onygenales sp. PD_40]
MDPQPRVLRPRPRKPFELAPPSAESSAPPTPAPEDSNTDYLEAKDSLESSRTHSILNLTSSTLLGIYSPTAFEGAPRDDLTNSTPWGTGAQTPNLRGASENLVNGSTRTSKHVRAAERAHLPRRHGFRGLYLPLILRSGLLFVFGIAYGTIITHLHDNPRLTPIKMENINHGSWQYMLFWGAAGVALGSLLPWFDLVWEDFVGEKVEDTGVGKQNGDSESPSRSRSSLAADWNPVVRSIGAFVGIAFAIRKLPWQSTLQVSLTLALVNPVLWYLIDRSKPGFMLSMAVGLVGMVTLLGINPDVVPPPATPSPNVSSTAGQSTDANGPSIMFVSQESIAVGTWIASVLFCSCVCFGNIGRRLALGQGRR